MINYKDHITKHVSIAPLAMFRVLFGFLMIISTIRFIVNGWIHEFYIAPKFHFTYYGFDWIKAFDAWGMYAVFLVMVLSAAGIMLGFYYRISSLLFFLSFTYVELIDKTNYLNHYYFVSVISFLMIWLPAHRYFSFDSCRRPFIAAGYVPAWTINIIKVQLFIVYFYAGIAKLNHDWLIEAMPLRVWLPVNDHIPLIGPLLGQLWVAYFFSWFGALYDIIIPFFLLKSKTRPVAYMAVIAFHMMTWLLFPIGMFPFIMIISTLIFFSSEFHQKIINTISGVFRIKQNNENTFKHNQAIPWILAGFILLQVLFPWRYLMYPGNLFWTEEGYRFSWRVMLIEKAGYVVFKVRDPSTGKGEEVYVNEYLTPLQEKMMSTQPDMILQFAHFLEEEYQKAGIKDPEVRAEAYVTLNGNSSRLFIDPEVDLTLQKESFKHKDWILAWDGK